jgi:hypothetical protein
MLSDWIEEDPYDLPVAPDELRAESGAHLATSTEQGRALVEAFLCEAASAR